MDLLKLKADLKQKASQMEELKRKIPKYFAIAAEDMAHANFSAQGFVVDGSASPKWKKRKKETSRTQGKRILSGTGYLQENIKAKALESYVKVGVDLSKVPYAQIHNEGGRLTQHVSAHYRTNSKTGKRYQVEPHSRKINMPQRKFLGYTPDIEKKAQKDIDYEMDKIFKS